MIAYNQNLTFIQDTSIFEYYGEWYERDYFMIYQCIIVGTFHTLTNELKGIHKQHNIPLML